MLTSASAALPSRPPGPISSPTLVNQGSRLAQRGSFAILPARMRLPCGGARDPSGIVGIAARQTVEPWLSAISKADRLESPGSRSLGVNCAGVFTSAAWLVQRGSPVTASRPAGGARIASRDFPARAGTIRSSVPVRVGHDQTSFRLRSQAWTKPP